TKHNAWFIPFVLLLHYACVVYPDVSLRPFSPPRIPLALVAMAVLGPLIFIGHWPWLWFDTLQHVRGYLSFHLHTNHYDIEYLGKNYNEPPSPASYPFVMTLFTVPTVTLVLALVGLYGCVHRPMREMIRRARGLPLARYDDPWRYPARRTWLRPGAGLN